MTKDPNHSTVAVSKEHLEKIHKIGKEDDRTTRAVIKIILEEYFNRRGV